MAAPLRVGVLCDLADAAPDPSNIERWLRLAADELIAKGRLGDIEFIHAYGLGLPSGAAAAVERAFEQLAAQDILMIIGPAIGDNALIAAPLAERHRIPAINWAGAERARGEWMFHLQVGSHEDESILIARRLAALGAQRVGVIFDASPIGEKHIVFLRMEAGIHGVNIAASATIAPLAEEASAQVAQLIDAGMDAFVYLGLGVSAPAAARALKAHKFDGPRIMNTAGLRGYQPGYADIIDGWEYVDMHADANTTLAALRTRLDIPAHGALAAAKGYDLGRLMAEGLARASEPTREGVKHGLERVKWLPAAEGEDGTLLGFGVQDRGALHGRYLVLRQWRGGKSMEVARQS